MSAAGTTSRAAETVAQRLGGDLLLDQRPHPDTVHLTVSPGALAAASEAAVRELGARFLISVPVDKRPLNGKLAVLHLYSLDEEHAFLALEADVDEGTAVVPTITGIVPGAAWAERESFDVMGIASEGHPDPRRLLLADDWPEGVYPLRRDFPYNFQPPHVEGAGPRLLDAPDGASVVPIGPFFPVLEEPSYWRLFVRGETIVGCDYRGFYNHRGIEKLGDTVLTYNEIPYVAERICGICGFIHSTCYCQAVEKAAGIVVPDRARFIRTIMLELERVHSHLLWLGIAGHILGFDTVLMQTWRVREPVMWLAEEISGNRKTYGMNTVGGLRRDFPDAAIPKLLEALDEVERESQAIYRAVAGDTTLHARTKRVGVLTPEWARAVCVVGPPARASAVRIDARIDHPYAAYDEVPPRLCSSDGCDVWARVVVRLDELLDSIRMVREAVSRLPQGPILVEISEEIPAGLMGISVVEAPRGEAVHCVITGGDNRPYRWRVRAPTYPNLQAVPAMVADQTIADVPITLGSLDPCFSCTERLETVDVATRRITVYSRQDLLRMSRDRGRTP